MAVRKVKCPVCGTSFAPKRSTAKFDKPACREKARRQRLAAAKAVAKTPANPAKKAAAKKTASPKRTQADQTKTKAADNHDLVVALRQELETAEALDTFEGQLALELARQLVTPGANAGSLADKVRAAKAAALGQVAGGDDPKPAEPEDDEVTRARRQREESRQAAGLS